MNQESRVNFFKDMAYSSYKLFCWTYHGSGEYLQSNCIEPAALDRFFSFTTCKQYMLDYAANQSAPLILSAPLGMKWAAVFEQGHDKPEFIHVIGPVLTSSVSDKNAENQIFSFSPDLARIWGKEFVSIIQSLPIISSSSFQHLTLMLNYSINSEDLKIDDICYQKGFSPDGSHTQSTEFDNAIWSWQSEQNLMDMVREGNVNYKDNLATTNTVDNIVQIKFGDPLRSAKYSAAVLIALCARSAVEGGLLTDSAYDLCIFYTQSVDDCNSIAEINTITYTMYDDFIHRVNKLHSNPKLSKMIQNCCEYVHQHAESTLSVSILAKRLGYADYYLTHKFRLETGQNLRDYIRDVKINKAKFLLTNSTLTVQQVSDKLHFSSRNYFSATFSKTVGIPPAEYQKKKRVCL